MAATALASSTAAAARPALVSYVSPAQLFPVEGDAFQSRADGRAVSYSPLPAFDHPHGRVVGMVQITDPDCIRAKQMGDCAAQLRWELVARDGARQELRTEEYSYETLALPTYRSSLVGAGGVWSRLATKRGEFWILTSAAEVFSYERLATYIGRFDRWCATADKCRTVDRAMAAAIRRFEARPNPEQPSTAAYQIVGRLKRGALHYYRVQLAPVSAGQSSYGLPRRGLVPVLNRDGNHAGYFYPRGC
ncbi:hypothetical protein [Rugamonas aquatica]|uniref:Uncharacterized protein n=1 Tax=Rugamonas aquatica TaxID=2743357 RepID=A0A6A7N706_9BURK|nr:hypothetical protein [Rugamonas aquatica]MQA40658.1 hypothetical protein [Rugamonas aquatica]